MMMNQRRPSRRAAALLLVCNALVAPLAHAQASAASQVQPPAASQAAVPGADQREAFRACDANAFLAMSIARNYLMGGRDKNLVLPHLAGSPAGQAMADELFRRVDDGEIRHPAQFASETLFRCAAAEKLKVGALRSHVALCFARTDIAFFMHGERANQVAQMEAMSQVSARLKERDIYPMALINQVAEAVYQPAQPPDLRQLMGVVLWRCIPQPPAAAQAASR